RIFRIKLKTKEIFSYHAGMHAEQRKRVEQWFYASDEGMLFATKAFGLGVDKKNIRTVVHYDLPSTYSEYLQEAGRAGRDEAPSLAVILYTKTELEQGKSELVSYLGDTTHCRRVTLLKQFTPRPPQSCFGCDVCSERVIHRPDGEQEILDCILHNNRRLRLSEAGHMLSGRWSRANQMNYLHLRWGFGLLSAWDIVDIKTAIRLMIADALSPLCLSKRKQVLYVKRTYD
ncbi:MAG: helicase-related protein, partial [Spirochaetota bacterium]